MEPSRVFLLLGVVFAVLAVVSSLVASTRIRVFSVDEKTIDTDKPELLLSSSPEMGEVNITRLIMENRGSTVALISISCSNRVLEDIGIDAYSTIEMPNLELTTPCWLIPSSNVSLNVRVEYVYEEMPYTYLSFISLLSMMLSLGLLFMYTYMKILRVLEERRKAQN